MFRCFNSNRLRKYSNDEIISIYATLKYDYFYNRDESNEDIISNALVEVAKEISLRIFS